MQLIQQVEIPEYIIRVKMSEKRRKKYYRKSGGKWKPRDLPKTYREKLLNGVYSLRNNKYLLDEHGDKIIANPQSAGKPKYRKLSGNDFASGYATPHIRAKLVRELKSFYRPFVRQMQPITEFPLWVEWHLYTTIPKRLFDLSNFWFYYKYFEDCLFETEDENGLGITPIIPDDNVKYISKPGTSPILYPIDNWEDRKFIFKFYKDERACLKENKFYEENYSSTG